MTVNQDILTAAGAQLSISDSVPDTNDGNGFSVLSFTPILNVTDLGAGGGKVFTEVTASILDRRQLTKQKGEFTFENRTMTFLTELNDPGQQILKTALNNDRAFSYKIDFNNGDVYFFTALNMGGADQLGGNNDNVSQTIDLAPCDETVKIADTGILTVSLTAGGTFTGLTDGDFEATQASTTGTGTGATFTVTLAAGAMTAIKLVKEHGAGYAAAEVITLLISGPTESVAATVTVDSIQ